MKKLFQIKICGITRPNDALEAFRVGADAIGLNFYSASKRYVDDFTANSISAAVLKGQVFSERPVHVIGVFVNSSTEQIVQKVIDCNLTGIQLHGDENCQFMQDLRNLFAENPELSGRLNPLLIKALRPRLCSLASPFDNPFGFHGDVIDSGPSSPVGIKGLTGEIDRWKAAGADAVLLDAPTPSVLVDKKGDFSLPVTWELRRSDKNQPVYGGTGLTIDWKSLAGVQFSLPYVLAGGLKPENVAMAIATSGARAVDVASGVETAPGIKCQKKVEQFVIQTGWKNV